MWCRGLLLIFLNFFLSKPQASAFDFTQLKLNLPQNSVMTVLQDQQGFLWLGTGTGLIKTDGIHQQLFQHDPSNPFSLTQNHVHSMLQSTSGDLWIATMNGISRYATRQNPHHQFRNYLRDPFATERQNRSIRQIYQDKQGRIWAGSPSELFRYQPTLDQFVPIRNQQQKPQTSITQFIEVENTLWIGGASGLARFDEETEQFITVTTRPIHFMHKHTNNTWLVSSGAYHQPEVLLIQHDGRHQPLPNLKNYLMFYQSQQQLWAYGTTSGLVKINSDLSITSANVVPTNLLNKKYPLTIFSMIQTDSGEQLFSSNYGVFRFYPLNEHWLPLTVDNSSLASQFGTFFKTRDGTILLGSTQSGLFRYVPTMRKFTHYNPPRVNPFDAHGSNGIRMVFEENEQQKLWLWLGTQSYVKRLLLNPNNRDILEVQNIDIRINSTSATAHSIAKLSDGQLLLAASSGLQIFNRKTQKFDIAPLQELLPAPPKFPDRDVHSTEVLDMMITRHCLWLATNAGLGCASPDGSKIIQWFGTRDHPAFNNNYLFKIYLANDESLWLSTEQGVIRFDPKSLQITQFKHDPIDGNSLAHDWVHGIWQTKADTFWIATREGGLNRLLWQPNKTPQWSRFGVKQGFPTEVVYGILGDNDGKLWLSSSNGIIRFDPDSSTVRHYQKADGLQSNEFNYSVMHIGQSGHFYFGGINGVNGFIPAEVRDNEIAPHLVLTGLNVNELPKEIMENDIQRLSHDENHLMFQYVGLHFAAPERVRYAYKLVGNDQEWQYATESYARYGALAAGDYDFWLKAANPDGVWSAPQRMLQLTIEPHPLQSRWAIVIYALIVLFALFGYKRFRDQSEQLLKEKISKGVAREIALNRSLQIQFDSTAHEMRTPLRRLGIQLERGYTALKNQHLPQAIQHLQKATQANTELQMLINRHLEIEDLRLRFGTSQQHLCARSIIENEINRYQIYYLEKQHQLVTDLQKLTIYIMPGLLELIVANLLSNACKYCPHGSIIRVSLNQKENWAELIVADNGPGIASEHQQDIFLRHYRLSGQENIPGSGEGLYLVKNAVQEAGGEIQLISSLNNGSSFMIHLPLGNINQVQPNKKSDFHTFEQDSNVNELIAPYASELFINKSDALTEVGIQSTNKITILVVEDNDGLREDLFELLSAYYHCITARSAEEGWTLACESLPDLIVSDVMMEQRNSGFILLKRLKSQLETSHIPVVMLTALSDERSQQQGYSYQADVYLCKSTTDQKLLAVITTHLQQRRRITNYVRRALQQLPQGTLSSDKEKFLAKLDAVFCEIFSDSTVTMDVIASHFYKSTSQLNRMSKQWLDGSVAEALTKYRLQKAKLLLENQNCKLTIEQIAEDCGFGNVKSLQRHWRNTFGVTPIQYRQGARHKEYEI